MSVSPSPIGGFAGQFFNNNGVILSGGKIYTYGAGTTTPLTTYTSISGLTAHANPIILDSAGRVPGGEIWLTNGLRYKFAIETSTSILLGTYDNVSGINSLNEVTPIIYNANGNGADVNFYLVPAPISKDTTNAYINGVYQQKNTYALSDVTLTFSEAPPFNSTIEIAYL
jgi:hypothetical protein